MTDEYEGAIAKIRQEFCAGLPRRMDGIGAALAVLGRGFDATAAEEFWRGAHSLEGTAASFGLLELSDRSGELSALGRSWLQQGTVPPDDLSAARATLHALGTACQALLVERENPEDP